MLTNQAKILLFAGFVTIRFDAGGTSDTCQIANHPEKVFVHRSSKACYVAFSTAVSWTEARVFCNTHGAVLARLVGNEFHKYLMYGRMFTHFNNNCVWIGLSFLEETGQWTWMDGSPMGKVKFTTDAMEQVFGYFGSCGTICALDTFLKVYEVSRSYCSWRKEFVCQYDFPVVTKEVSTVSQTDSMVLSAEPLPMMSSGTPKPQTSPVGDSPSMAPTAPGVEEDKYTQRTAKLHIKTHVVEQHSKPRRKPNLRRRQTEGPSRPQQFAVKTSANSRCSDEPVFRDSAFLPTMCYRKCSKRSENCRAFNFNVITRECVGFSTSCQDRMESTDHWELWEVQGPT